MTVYDSTNPIPVDAPFSKMLGALSMDGYFPGFPHTSSGEYSLQQLAVYEKAAKLLGLVSTDPMYLAYRIRHLDYCIRNSKFKDVISWRSGLEALNQLDSIFDQPHKLVESTKTSNLNISYYISGPLNKFNLQWSLRVYGIYPSLKIDINGLFNQSWSAANPISFELGTSGYNVTLKCTAGNGDPVEGLFKFITPYSGDLVQIWKDIKLDKDFLTQLMYGKSEYSEALFFSTSVEDGIAAFILAVNEA